NFTFRYRQDLTHVTAGSPFQSVISAFSRGRRIEMLTGTVEVHGGPGDGALTHSSLLLGRQSQYSTDVASFDGVTYTQMAGRARFTVFGGRRFTYFDDPVQRAIGGSEVLIRLPR